MYKKTEVIDGQEVEVKVYAPRIPNRRKAGDAYYWMTSRMREKERRYFAKKAGIPVDKLFLPKTLAVDVPNEQPVQSDVEVSGLHKP